MPKTNNVCFLYFVTMFRYLSGDVLDVHVLEYYNLVSNGGKYLNTRPPSPNNKYHEPVNVNVSLFIRNIGPIDDKNMDLNIILTFRASWMDPRLNSNNSGFVWPWDDRKKYVVFKETSKIWTPDISFLNKKRSYELVNVFGKNLFIRLYPNGTLYASKTLFLSLACPMNLKQFPFDRQTCNINLASYSETIDHVQLIWEEENAVKITEMVFLPKFSIEKCTTTYRTSQTNTGEYSSMSVSFLLVRKFHSYFFEYYVPVVLVVLISWLPFWLDRVLILRIYVAFCTTIFLSWHLVVKPNEVIVSYITLLDFWRGINLLFVFVAAFESVFITYIIKTNRNCIKRTCKEDNEKFQMLACGNNYPEKRKYLEVIDEKTDIDLEVMKIKANFKICFINVQKEVEIVDTVAKLFFPSSYVIFLFFYWLKC